MFNHVLCLRPLRAPRFLTYEVQAHQHASSVLSVSGSKLYVQLLPLTLPSSHGLSQIWFFHTVPVKILFTLKAHNIYLCLCTGVAHRLEYPTGFCTLKKQKLCFVLFYPGIPLIANKCVISIVLNWCTLENMHIYLRMHVCIYW